ncbi:MAG: GxxExxY protein [Verrucomicrobia bacterium]|nr:GxxExxY protein [Verrucomicrobiota bacterium]
MTNEEMEALTRRVVGLAIKVHRYFGQLRNEPVYRNALLVEFRREGLSFEKEKVHNVYYGEELVGSVRLDLIVERELVIELKVQPKLERAHEAQLVSYLHATKLDRGLLINMGGPIVEFRTKRRELPSHLRKPAGDAIEVLDL